MERRPCLSNSPTINVDIAEISFISPLFHCQISCLRFLMMNILYHVAMISDRYQCFLCGGQCLIIHYESSHYSPSFINLISIKFTYLSWSYRKPAAFCRQWWIDNCILSLYHDTSLIRVRVFTLFTGRRL